MKFMKLGTRPDTFYTENATRTVISDIPSDLTIRINNVTYHLHKFPLLPKCGLLQLLCSGATDSSNITLEMHDIPGGEEAFELCAKFCYGITINLSAQNFAPSMCAAKYLRMTEAAEKGNFSGKLDSFFTTCILEGWKDTIVTLQTTEVLREWSESLGITRRCIDSLVEKILTPLVKVTWSFTYTRPGFGDKKRQQSVPKDWWTEDISDLDIEMFRCIITMLRSTNLQPPQLIGEALHVYACRWLPDVRKSRAPEGSASNVAESVEKKQLILDNIVGMIPPERGSVSTGFLLRLVSTAFLLGAPPVTKTELIQRSGLQLDEATLNDLLLPAHSSIDQNYYDVDMVGAVLESFLRQWRRRQYTDAESQYVKSVQKVGRLIDSYLQVVARDPRMIVPKMVSLAGALPQIARPDHDELYKAINLYLKEHPDINKADKKTLCRVLDCQKLTPQIRTHAVRNERLPLRTVVQVLFFEQDKEASSAKRYHNVVSPEHTDPRQQPIVVPQNELRKLYLHSEHQQAAGQGLAQSPMPGSSGVQTRAMSDDKLFHQRPELRMSRKLKESTSETRSETHDKRKFQK